MGLWLVNAESLHEPAVLLRGKGFGLAFFSRPLEGTRFQTLVEEKKAVSLPVQRLDPVPPPSAEKNKQFSKGSSENCCLTSAASPSIPSRRSV